MKILAKSFGIIKRLILVVAVLSIYIFFFKFLEASDGLEIYLGICATILTIYLYAKRNEE